MKVRRRKSSNLLMISHSMGKVSRRNTTFVPMSYPFRRLAKIVAVTAVAALGVMVAVWGVMTIVSDVMKPEIDNTPSAFAVSEDAAKYGDTDAATIMLMRVSDDLKTPEMVILTRFEPSEEKVYITPIYTETVFGGKTLTEHFADRGAEACAAAVAETVGCDTIPTVQFTFKQTRLFINALGGVEITVPYRISYHPQDSDRNLNVAAGTRLYTGGETARLLNYPDWEGGMEEHQRMYCQVVERLINDILTPDNAEKEGRLKALYLTVCNETTFDMSATKFYDMVSGLTYLAAKNDGDLTMVVDIKATEREDGTRTYDEKNLMTMKAVFGDREAE